MIVSVAKESFFISVANFNLGLSSSSGSVAGFATSFGNRYIHASGFEALSFFLIVTSCIFGFIGF